MASHPNFWVNGTHPALLTFFFSLPSSRGLDWRLTLYRQVLMLNLSSFQDCEGYPKDSNPSPPRVLFSNVPTYFWGGWAG